MAIYELHSDHSFLSQFNELECFSNKIFFESLEDPIPLLSRLPEHGLAVVGTRLPQARSRDLVHRTLSHLKDTRKIILSGLASGIDAEAHRAAIANNLPTVAVLGSGLKHTYPKQNIGLREDILKAGGVIASEYPLELAPRPRFFLQRNRLIAGWSKAVWIVEASYKSGAVNTAHWGIKMERDVYATPSFPGDPAFTGNQRILENNTAHCFWGAPSFSCTWLDLLSNLAKSEKRESDIEKILQFCEEIAMQSKNCDLHRLSQFAGSKNWSQKRFLEAFRVSLETGKLRKVGHEYVSARCASFLK